MAQIRVVNPSKINQTRRRSIVQRTIRINQAASSATGLTGGTNVSGTIAQITANQDKLRKENVRLKTKIESMQAKLDEIADVASATGNDDDFDADVLADKMNTILDLAAPGSADDDDDEDGVPTPGTDEDGD